MTKREIEEKLFHRLTELETLIEENSIGYSEGSSKYLYGYDQRIREEILWLKSFIEDVAEKRTIG